MGTTGYKVQPDHLFWINVRQTGTSPALNRILEIAYVYTDLKLSSYHPGSHIVLNCPENELKSQPKEEIK
jgi:oligoribonuclease (3'-5' exoribonuclease)